MTVDDKQRIDRWLGAWLLVLLRPLAQLTGRFMQRDHSPAPQGEIVFLKLMGGGSLLIALPALLGVRRRYPDHALTLVCGSPVAPFAELCGVFDRVERVEDRRGLAALLWSTARVLARLVRRRVDTVVDLEVYSQLSTVFSLLTLARNRIGFYVESTYWRRNVLTHLVFFNRARGVFHFYAAAAALLGAPPATRGDVRAHLRARLGPVTHAGEYFALGAGCSDFASVRQLPAAEWRAWAQARRGELAGRLWRFLGDARDRAVAEEVAAALRDALGGELQHENLCGQLTLGESLGVLAHASRFFGIDSALVHAARALGVPSVSFFGPTDPATLLEPIEGYSETVHYRPPICSPCLHVAQVPPCKGENVCMRLFTLDRVPATPWCEDASGRSVLPARGPA
ncbi:MAG TPA: glycosyltransferase family 9 protein [Myxococcota bacterium]|nr:glycosyltransferase family 9 protein [Myxococcota bacterium]